MAGRFWNPGMQCQDRDDVIKRSSLPGAERTQRSSRPSSHGDGFM